MKYLQYLLSVLIGVSLFFLVTSSTITGCVPTAQVKDSDGLVGYYNYQPIVKKIVDDRAAACEGVEGCVPEPLTEQDVLGVITSVTRSMAAEGATVIGIEAEKARIWFEK